jgi:hypothetical protein
MTGKKPFPGGLARRFLLPRRGVIGTIDAAGRPLADI